MRSKRLLRLSLAFVSLKMRTIYSSRFSFPAFVYLLWLLWWIVFWSPPKIISIDIILGNKADLHLTYIFWIRNEDKPRKIRFFNPTGKHCSFLYSIRTAISGRPEKAGHWESERAEESERCGLYPHRPSCYRIIKLLVYRKIYSNLNPILNGTGRQQN